MSSQSPVISINQNATGRPDIRKQIFTIKLGPEYSVKIISSYFQNSFQFNRKKLLNELNEYRVKLILSLQKRSGPDRFLTGLYPIFCRVNGILNTTKSELSAEINFCLFIRLAIDGCFSPNLRLKLSSVSFQRN